MKVLNSTEIYPEVYLPQYHLTLEQVRSHCYIEQEKSCAGNKCKTYYRLQRKTIFLPLLELYSGETDIAIQLPNDPEPQTYRLQPAQTEDQIEAVIYL